MTKFSEFQISEATQQSLEKMGFEEATPIQSGTIEPALEGRDVIGQAQTGTGKTTAFGVPMVERINTDDRSVQGIIIAPTRELAIQVSEEINRIGRGKRIQVLSVFGGQDIGRQIRALKRGPHIVVGTPGRLIDHIERRTLKLGNVQTLVLDEADEMLNMGFIDDIRKILAHVPEERQTLLFSATMPGPIRKIAEKFMKEPVTVKIKSKAMTVDNIEQHFVKVQDREKFDVLTRLLNVQKPKLAIVFARTKRRVDEVAQALNVRGYSAEGIHGDLTQSKRMSVLRQFKNQTLEILVATDVAARGLDISGVTHVYNFDVPQDPESYVHRIGRTGRAGEKGMSVTFVVPREMSYLRVIERTTNQRMTPLRPPTEEEALVGQQVLAKEQLIETIEKNELNDYRPMADHLLESNDPVDLIAAALKILTREPDETPVKITEERPLPNRNRRGGGGGGRGRNRNNKGGRGRNNRRGGRGGNSRRNEGGRKGGNRRRSPKQS